MQSRAPFCLAIGGRHRVERVGGVAAQPVPRGAWMPHRADDGIMPLA